MVINHEKFVRTLLEDTNRKLEHLNEQHKIAIAVYEAKRDVLMKNQLIYEKELSEINKER